MRNNCYCRSSGKFVLCGLAIVVRLLSDGMSDLIIPIIGDRRPISPPNKAEHRSPPLQSAGRGSVISPTVNVNTSPLSFVLLFALRSPPPKDLPWPPRTVPGSADAQPNPASNADSERCAATATFRVALVHAHDLFYTARTVTRVHRQVQLV